MGFGIGHGGCVAQETERAGDVLQVCGAQGAGGGVVAHVVVAVGQAEPALRRGRDHHRTVLEVGRAAEVEQRVPAVVVAAGQGARQVFARRDRIETGQLVFQGIGAGALDGGRVHTGRVERAQLLLRRLGVGGRRGSEPVHDAVQRLVVALDELGEAAVHRVLGRERGTRQPAAVREAVEVLAGGAGRVQVGRVQTMVGRGLGCGSRGERCEQTDDELTATAGHTVRSWEGWDVSEYARNGWGVSRCAVRRARSPPMQDQIR